MAPVGHVHPGNVWECHFPLGSQKPKRSTMGGADRELRWHDISLIILEDKAGYELITKILKIQS